jgi:hypothetical protein
MGAFCNSASQKELRGGQKQVMKIKQNKNTLTGKMELNLIKNKNSASFGERKSNNIYKMSPEQRSNMQRKLMEENASMSTLKLPTSRMDKTVR